MRYAPFEALRVTCHSALTDAGIIASFKAHYRKLFIQQRINFLNTTITGNVLKYNIKHAIYGAESEHSII